MHDANRALRTDTIMLKSEWATQLWISSEALPI